MGSVPEASAIGRWVGYLVLAVFAVVAAAMLTVGVAVIAVDFLGGGRSATVAIAGASLAMAGATVGLLVGSAVAAWYFRGQVVETRRASHAALRPLVTFDGVVAGSLRVRLAEDGDISLRIKNVGVGPALDVAVRAWDGYDYEGSPLDAAAERLDTAPPTRKGGPEILAAGETVEVLLFPPGDLPAETRAAGPIHLRITYADVFGNEFAVPAEGEPPFLARFVRAPI